MSWKNKEIESNREVNLSFSDPNNHTYVSLSCTCNLDQSNTQLMKELWNPYCEIYFPKGVTDPNLSLIVCEIHHAGKCLFLEIQLNNNTHVLSSGPLTNITTSPHH